jgi:hypothetical protein
VKELFIISTAYGRTMQQCSFTVGEIPTIKVSTINVSRRPVPLQELLYNSPKNWQTVGKHTTKINKRLL